MDYKKESIKVLKKYWGYPSFRDNQEFAIEDLLKENDVVYIAKTWDWKSVCFQIPSIIKKGTAIIVSPLKALMKDQVKNLEKRNIRATYLNSDLEQEESKQRFINLLNWEYDLLYVSPEKLSNENFLDYLVKIPDWISYFIIDEFDSIDEYGNTGFRPEYLELGKIKSYLEEKTWKKIPVWVFTATATPKIRDFTIKILDLKAPKTYIGDLIGEHIKIDINKYKDKKEKDSYLYWYLKKIEKELKKESGSCIIFCSTRKTVDNLEKQLKLYKFKVAKYHAWMATSRKESSAKKFMENKVDFIVCTNAFWRGVDKPDIRYVIHYWIPWNITSYLQEIGRVGRDRKPSTATLLFSQKDVVTRRFISRLPSQQEELDKMLDIFNTENCYIKEIKEYFGREYEKATCNQCSNCVPSLRVEVKKNEDFKVVKIKRKVTKKKKKSTMKKKSIKKKPVKKAKKTVSKKATKKKPAKRTKRTVKKSNRNNK